MDEKMEFKEVNSTLEVRTDAILDFITAFDTARVSSQSDKGFVPSARSIKAIEELQRTSFAFAIYLKKVVMAGSRQASEHQIRQVKAALGIPIESKLSAEDEARFKKAMGNLFGGDSK